MRRVYAVDATEPARARGLLAGFTNSADLGGLPLPSGEQVPARRVIRANTPDHLNPSQLAATVSFGFSAVLDLRSQEEVLAYPHPLAQLSGYRSLPLIDPVAEAREDFSRFTTLGEIYSSSLQRNATHIAAIFTAVADAGPRPMMVSCRAGRDRTGMVIALLLDLVGVGHDVIAADYALLPESSDTSAAGSGRHRSGDADIRAMLDHVHAVYSSTEAYLRWLQLADSSIEAIRRRLQP